MNVQERTLIMNGFAASINSFQWVLMASHNKLQLQIALPCSWLLFNEYYKTTCRKHKDQVSLQSISQDEHEVKTTGGYEFGAQELNEMK